MYLCIKQIKFDFNDKEALAGMTWAGGWLRTAVGQVRERRLEPPPEPVGVGVCWGCREAILDGEEYYVFENGRRIHAGADCKTGYVDRLLGLR